MRGKGKASAGILERLLGRPDSSPHGELRLPGPLAGVCSPAHQEADSMGAQQVHDRRSSLALSSPAETCAGGSGLILRVWVPAHNPNSVETAPEAKPTGGALCLLLIGECTASREVRLLGEEEEAQPRQAESPACPELSEPPVQQSSRSSQKPHLAEFLSRGFSAMGETCPELPCF